MQLIYLTHVYRTKKTTSNSRIANRKKVYPRGCLLVPNWLATPLLASNTITTFNTFKITGNNMQQLSSGLSWWCMFPVSWELRTLSNDITTFDCPVSFMHSCYKKMHSKTNNNTAIRMSSRTFELQFLSSERSRNFVSDPYLGKFIYIILYRSITLNLKTKTFARLFWEALFQS